MHGELEQAWATFRTLMGSASDKEPRRRSAGTWWTNKQLLFHMRL
jgi:hypothetical protein